MASIAFCFPKKKKKKKRGRGRGGRRRRRKERKEKRRKENASACLQGRISTMLLRVPASTLNLGFVRWLLARVREYLYNRTVPFAWLGAWEGNTATDHQLRSCPSKCCCCFFFTPTPQPFLSLSELQPICKPSLPQGQIWKSEEQHNLSKCGRKWRNQAPC